MIPPWLFCRSMTRWWIGGGRRRDETLEGWQRERDGRDKEEGWFEGWETEEQQQQQQQEEEREGGEKRK